MLKYIKVGIEIEGKEIKMSNKKVTVELDKEKTQVYETDDFSYEVTVKRRKKDKDLKEILSDKDVKELVEIFKALNPYRKFTLKKKLFKEIYLKMNFIGNFDEWGFYVNTVENLSVEINGKGSPKDSDFPNIKKILQDLFSYLEDSEFLFELMFVNSKEGKQINKIFDTLLKKIENMAKRNKVYVGELMDLFQDEDTFTRKIKVAKSELCPKK